MLETPLDKVEPYTAFKHSLLRKAQGTFSGYSCKLVDIFCSFTTRRPRTVPRVGQKPAARRSRHHPSRVRPSRSPRARRRRRQHPNASGGDKWRSTAMNQR